MSTKKYKMGKITTELFILKARLLYGDQHDYSKVNYIDNKTKVCIICRKHLIEFWKTPHAYLSKKLGCPECSKERSSLKRRKTTLQFIEEAKKIHGEKYDYSKVIYVTNKSKVHIICPIHGDFEQSPSNHLKGEGCPYCKQSRLETSIYTLLQKNNMVFETLKSFSWLKNTSTNFPLYLDFYLPTFNLAIECLGLQHFTPVTYFDGIEGFLKTLERDKLKLSLCTEHNIKILYYVNDTINVPYNWELYPVIKTKNELLNNIKIF